MRIGKPDAWLNRKIPIVRICIAVGVVLAGLYLWAAYGDLFSSVVWGIRNQRTVSFRGQTLQVPWFWRQEEWINYNQFELTRQYGGFALSSNVTVRYQNISPGDVQGVVETRKRTAKEAEQMFHIPGLSYNDFQGDDFTRAQYICLKSGLISSPMFYVDCYSRDGRWNVSISGLKRTRSEFEAVLRGVASMGNPSK